MDGWKAWKTTEKQTNLRDRTMNLWLELGIIAKGMGKWVQKCWGWPEVNSRFNRKKRNILDRWKISSIRSRKARRNVKFVVSLVCRLTEDSFHSWWKWILFEKLLQIIKIIASHGKWNIMIQTKKLSIKCKKKVKLLNIRRSSNLGKKNEEETKWRI